MRIVAGEFGGRTIKAPKGRGTRPTTDRVREALMSSVLSLIGGDIADLRVLDAFAGSGALGLEALSRGAAHVTFVERDPAALAALRANVDGLGVPMRTRILAADVFSLARRGALAGPFSLILLDPPYTLDAVTVCSLLETLSANGDVAADAVVSWEHAASSEPTWPVGFRLHGRKRYGTSAIDLGVWEGAGSTP